VANRRVVVHKCGVDAEAVENPEGIEAGFEGVTNEDGEGCHEKGEELHLDLGDGRRGHEVPSVIPDHLDGGRCACVVR